jgi:hypothetical protein
MISWLTSSRDITYRWDLFLQRRTVAVAAAQME